LGGGAYLAFALARFPAAAAYRWFAPDGLSVSGISGTVWQGTAVAASLPGLPLSNLRWRLDALPLLIGRIGAAFEAELADGFVGGDVSASFSRVTLEDVQLGTTLQNLNRMLPIASTEGRISAELETLVLEDGWPVAAAGIVRVGELEVAPLMAGAGASLIPLGDFLMTFTPREAPGIFASIEDTGGPVDVMGSFALAPDGAYRFDGLIGTRPDASPMLVEGLEVMQSLGYVTGDPDPEGRREFTFPGRISRPR
jgi:general secretion pathway protein N